MKPWPHVIICGSAVVLTFLVLAGFFPNWDGSWLPWHLSWWFLHSVAFGTVLSILLFAVLDLTFFKD